MVTVFLKRLGISTETLPSKADFGICGEHAEFEGVEATVRQPMFAGRS